MPEIDANSLIFRFVGKRQQMLLWLSLMPIGNGAFLEERSRFSMYKTIITMSGLFQPLQTQYLYYTILTGKSNVLSIGTADSAQAERLLDFMKSCVEKVDQRIQRTQSVDS